MRIFNHDELLSALLDGAFETPLWGRFLSLLRERTGAHFASLDFRPFARPSDEAVNLFSGEPLPDVLKPSIAMLMGSNRPLPHHLPPEGRPYSLDEIVEGVHGDKASLRIALKEGYGLSAVRQMRVREASGVDAWLTITRSHGNFSPDDEHLLAWLAPTLRSVVRAFVAIETERSATAAANELMQRLQFGWFRLDAAGRILECDSSARALLSQKDCLGQDSRGRITAREKRIEREIYQSLLDFVENPNRRARAISVSRDPWFDLLMLHARSWRVGEPKATVLVYVQRDPRLTSQCHEQLAEFFGLALREARIALALSRGMTIAEAAKHLGLTENSARMYTKSIYSKTGARGLPDLVRIVGRSALVLSA